MRTLFKSAGITVFIASVFTLLSLSLHQTFAAVSYTGIKLPYEAGGAGYVVRGTGSTHSGSNRHAVDFGMPNDTEVLAIHDGIVHSFGWDHTGGGNMLIIDHQDDYCSVYLHLNKSYVNEGMSIQQGHLVALSGETGFATTGPHLHLAVTQKPEGQSCTTNHSSEIAMLFEEHPHGELNMHAQIPSQNAKLSSPSFNKRVGYIDVNGSLFVKEGGLSTNWVKQTGRVADFQLEADRIAFLNIDDELFIKEGPLNATWVKQTGRVADFQLEGDRIAFLNIDGELFVKEGPLNATWVKQTGRVADFQLEGDRIAFLNIDGELFVKEGPLNATWVKQTGRVADFQLEGDRIAFLNIDDELFVKEGPLNATWVKQTGRVADFQLEGDRIAFLNIDGDLFVKEGPLNATWVKQTGRVADFQLEGDRIAFLNTDDELFVKEGPLNATWVKQTGNTAKFRLGKQRILILNKGGTLIAKEGPLNATWHFLASDVIGFQIDGQNRPVYYRPQLSIDAENGAAGSYFSFTISDYSASTTTSVFANNTYLGDVVTNSAGDATFIISTDSADEGFYQVTTDLNAVAKTVFLIDNMAPLHGQNNSTGTFDMPSGISFQMLTYLPLIVTE